MSMEVKTKIRKNYLKQEIFKKINEYYRLFHKKSDFVPGKSFINYGGRVYDHREIINLADSALEFWLTSGRYCAKFEEKLAKFLGIKYCSLVNSGSSANLIAFMSLTSTKLGVRRIKPGDEVITTACAFPTTVAPLIQAGAVPVFVDVALPSYNLDCSLLKKALSKKTKAVILAHTLGNPFNIKAVKEFCDSHGLWLIEDNCDSMGSRYKLNGKWGYTGTFGHVGTSSFYPPHHITTGEGGAVYTNDPQLKKIMDSFRDWGRDCWCPSGRDNTCGKRFFRKFGELPLGYDHKYVYSHFGYNLKATDMQASVGLAQIEKLHGFMKARRENWKYLRENMNELSKWMILPEPEKDSAPSWFGFLMTVKENTPFTRMEMADYLEKNKIQTRMLFAGNLIRQPCFDELRKSGKYFRVVSGRSSLANPRRAGSLSVLQFCELPVTDYIMSNSLWLGVYPGMTEEMLEYIVMTIKKFFQSPERNRFR